MQKVQYKLLIASKYLSKISPENPSYYFEA
jgi:hypothetical protein